MTHITCRSFRSCIPISLVLTLFIANWSLAQNLATTVQLPTFGVAIDADGVLSMKVFPDPGRKLIAARFAAAKAALPGDLAGWADMRKISLVQLEHAVRRRVAAGQPPTDEMQNLAGLQRLEYVFFLPEKNDIVIAGPAEGFVQDLSGRALGITTGKPVLQLDDLIVALRTYSPGTRHRPFIGCTIDPSRDGLAKLAAFQRTIPRSVPQRARQQVAVQIGEGMRSSLGMAQTRVFGVSSKTRFAQVMIEADYRMKMIGIGLEEPPVKMATFLASLGTPKHFTLQRWWFVPNYDCVRVADDRNAMQLVGQGVQLLTEDKLIGPDGTLMNKNANPSAASQRYATSFTSKYDEISSRLAVYGQLRNLVDMLIAAAFIRQQDLYGKSGWTLGTFANEAALAVETEPNPQQVACPVNVIWRGNRLLAPAGGGVSIMPHESLDPKRLVQDENGLLKNSHDQVAQTVPADRWWWD